MTVGREGCDITLNDHQVSRRHLVLKPAGRELGLEDLGSTNGTDVDGGRIAEPVNVGDGAVVHVGTSEFIVQVTVPAAVSQPTAPSAIPAAPATAPRPLVATADGLPRWFWTVAGLVEIGLILTAATLLVYYAVR
jgi:hypothetical protein